MPSERSSRSNHVAVVHDYLNQRGGAERVVLEMARLWPEAPIYTSLYRPDSTFPEFRTLDVRTSFLDRLPVDRRFRALAPLYPAAFGSLGPIDADVVVSSSSGWAHSVSTSARAKHVVYCYAPARWLYRTDHYLTSRARRAASAPMLAALRRWDRTAARRADLYVVIAENVRRRVMSAYGIDSIVVHPPVDVHRFTPSPRGERLLVVSRLLDYKRVDLAVRAATDAGVGLDVVGTGPLLEELRAMAGPTVTFHGVVDDATLHEMIQCSRAVLTLCEEDFGLVPLEANAAGKPAVAFAAGGALETLRDGETAALFREQTPEAVLDAVHRADALETTPEQLAAAASAFAPERFRDRLASAVQDLDHRDAGGS